jgi:hypothetical protein
MSTVLESVDFSSRTKLRSANPFCSIEILTANGPSKNGTRSCIELPSALTRNERGTEVSTPVTRGPCTIGTVSFRP